MAGRQALSADAYEQLKVWHEQVIKLFIYSSGSLFAQKLLYAHTKYGDLTPLFSGYFDTNIGAKTEAASYQAIVKALGLEADEVLFLSDSEAELDAARDSGMQTRWLVREVELETDAAHLQVAQFTQIQVSL